MLVHQVGAELPGIDPVDVDQRDAARGGVVVQGRPDLDLRAGGDEGLDPAVAEIAQACGLPLGTDAPVERQRRADGVVVGGRVGADLLVLPDIIRLAGGGGHHRPDRLDLGLADIKQARADRGEQPLVQAGGEIVAVQLVAGEREVGERMGTVDEDLDAQRAGHLHDVADGQDLPRDVDDVGELDDLGPRGDRALDLIDEVRGRGERHLEGDALDDDALAAGALVPRR